MSSKQTDQRFSLIETRIAATISVILVAVALPQLLAAVYVARLRIKREFFHSSLILPSLNGLRIPVLSGDRAWTFPPDNFPRMRDRRTFGFSIIELMVVAVIAILAAAIAVPNLMNALHSAKLRGAGSDFSSISQSGRIRAVQDNRFYSIYIWSGSPQQAFVDIYPQHANGTSGNGGTPIDPSDPAMVIPSEVAVIAAGNAPDTTNLKGLFLPAGSSLPVNDGGTSSTPITFGPRGLPCTQQTASDGSASGTVCDSAGGATAFWVFFENNMTQAWEAVTVSPSGRIQKWEHSTGGWAKISD